MMPEGVEHEACFGAAIEADAVTDSMMPEGVEHPISPDNLRPVRTGDRFHDAGRR